MAEYSGSRDMGPCDLCGASVWYDSGSAKPHYCWNCRQTKLPISDNDLLDAHAALKKKLTLNQLLALTK